MFTVVQDTRREWEAVTEPTRQIAVAADLELRRRHPSLQLEPLRPHPSETAGVIGPEQPGPVRADAWTRDTLDGLGRLAEGTAPAGQLAEPATSSQRDAVGQLALGLTPDTARAEIPEQVLRIAQNARIAQAKLDELTNTPPPRTKNTTCHQARPGQPRAGPDRDAVLQPPGPT